MIDPELQRKIDELKAELLARDQVDEATLEARLRQGYADLGLPLPKDRYILEGEKLIAVDAPRWVAWTESHGWDRIVARTSVSPTVEVSTVFLGVNHNFSGTGPQILFETMVFGGLLDLEMDRYATLAEARAGHWAMVDRVKRAESVEAL